MILPFLSAILGILAFLPPQFIGASLALGGPANFWFFGFFFLVPLFIFFIKENKFWRLVLGAFIFRLIFGLGTAYFTLEPIMWGFSILIFLGLPVSIFLIKKIYKYLLPATATFYALIFSLPFLWTLFDHLEARYSLLPTYIVTSGNVFGSSPFIGLAGIGGLTLLTFFAALMNALVAFLTFPPKADPPLAEKIKTVNYKFLILNSTLILLLILFAWQISYYQLRKNSVYYDGLKNSLRISVVSVNEKFDFSQADQLKKALTNGKSDLIIFPEDMFNDFNGARSFNFYQNLAKELNTNLLATFNTRQNGKRYNSTILFNSNGEAAGVYSKNRLTFMGEYWPFGNRHPFFYDWLRKDNPEYKNYAIFNPQNAYSQGDKKILSINQNGSAVKFASLICLEIHYPADLKEYKKMGAQFIVNPTSNRWLTLGTNHYLYLTGNLRKIESVWLRVPIISSGVRDFAGIIAPDGKMNQVNYENQKQNYEIFTGEINLANH